MSTPKVTVIYSNGNLLQDASVLDSIAGMVFTVVTGGLIGAPKVVYNLKDAEDQGFTESAEPFAHRHLKEFYSELNGNQELHVMGVADTMTMAQMLDNTSLTGAKKLTTAAGGKIRLLGVMRKPPVGYVPGDDFMDADVAAAVTASKIFGEARLAELTPLRMMIEGRVNAEASGTIYEPKTATNGYSGVVLGGTLNDKSASVGLALGRAVRYAAHIKIGKVANGPLNVNSIYIGTKELKDVLNVETLHGKGYISFVKHPQKAGFFFGIDRMTSIDDYRLLAYGRVVDKAAIIAATVYVNELESEVDVDQTTGFISELDIDHLRGRIEQQINVQMADQISGVEIYINPAQDIVNTGKLVVRVRIIPKGYTTFIEVDLGLLAPAVA